MRDVSFKTLIILGLALVAFYLFPIFVLVKVASLSVFHALREPSFLQAIEVTIIMATAASIISVAFGIPLGYFMARYDFRGKYVLDALLDVPIMIPHIVVGIMIVLAFASSYGMGPLLSRLGVSFIDTLWGAVAAVTYLSSTYTVRTIETAIRMINPDMELTARTLGATRSYVLMHLIIPYIRRSIANGAMLSWSRSVSEAGALFIVAYYVFLGRSTIVPASIYIYESYIGIGLTNAAMYSAALILVIFAIFIIYKAVIGISDVHSHK
ncbi:molybdenum ABC transporter permease [Thermocladium modestius]|uniref:Molybdenum ABC transporter permease n=1 Tax=Thermocladium modestius TaxID=62609 RepID=A0A830GV20_9CREN|nr:molybdenum ABC transporter permease [Thermocladium modestius]